MNTKWLISINPPAVGTDPKYVDPTEVTRLHGPFESDDERHQKAGELASDLGYPDDLVFAPFDIVDGRPILRYE